MGPTPEKPSATVPLETSQRAQCPAPSGTSPNSVNLVSPLADRSPETERRIT